ncbi:hypothetical protein LCGC14_1694890, partial [marine sediment metagenome]
LWIMDGQHRTLAASKRADIPELPCIIFLVIGRDEEAKGFLGANTVRGPVKSLAKFKAQLMAHDPAVCDVNGIVQRHGYVIGDRSPNNIACVSLLLVLRSRDRELLLEVLGLCVEVYAGKSITEQCLGGCFHLERQLRKHSKGSLFHTHNRKALVSSGPDGIKTAISKTMAYYAKGGEAVWAQAIVDLLNHRRSTRRLPHVISS